MKQTRKRVNSTTAIITLAREQDAVEIPKSVQLTPEEAQLWPEFASARSRSDWRRMDLLLLAKIVKLEPIIRRHLAMIEEAGWVSGEGSAHPLITIMDRLQRQQLSLIRVLSLTQKEDGRLIAGREARTRTFTQARAKDNDDLMAH